VAYSAGASEVPTQSCVYCLSGLAFSVLGPGRLCLAVVLEVVSEDLLEEY